MIIETIRTRLADPAARTRLLIGLAVVAFGLAAP